MKSEVVATLVCCFVGFTLFLCGIQFAIIPDIGYNEISDSDSEYSIFIRTNDSGYSEIHIKVGDCSEYNFQFIGRMVSPCSEYRFVTPDESHIVYIAEQIMSLEHSFENRIDTACRLVNYIVHYKSDSDDHWVFDYKQYPAETLRSRSGDCEDYATLLASIIKAMRYDAMVFSNHKHAVVGVLDEKGGYLYKGEHYSLWDSTCGMRVNNYYDFKPVVEGDCLVWMLFFTTITILTYFAITYICEKK